MLWAPKYTGRLRGYVFAPPGVLSLGLAASPSLRNLLTAVVLGDDLICRLCLGSVEDLRNAIAARVLGLGFGILGLARPPRTP